MERPTHFILSGYVYSGKTSLAKKIAAVTNAIHIAGDHILKEWGITEKNHRPSHDQLVKVEFEQRVERAVKAGKSVVDDRGLSTREKRDEVKIFSRNLGAQPLLIYVDTSEEEIWRRWERSEEAPDRIKLSRERVQWKLDIYQPPTEDEEHIVFRSGIDTVPEWMKKNATFLGY